MQSKLYIATLATWLNSDWSIPFNIINWNPRLVEYPYRPEVAHPFTSKPSIK